MTQSLGTKSQSLNPQIPTYWILTAQSPNPNLITLFINLGYSAIFATITDSATWDSVTWDCASWDLVARDLVTVSETSTDKASFVKDKKLFFVAKIISCINRRLSLAAPSLNSVCSQGRHDIQHNDSQHNDI